MRNIKLSIFLLFIVVKIQAQLKLEEPDISLLKFLPELDKLELNTDSSLNKYHFIRIKNVEYVVKYCSFDYPNEIYWKMKDGNISDSLFNKYMSIYNHSSNDILKSRRIKQRLKILYGLNINNLRTITIDTDNDDDFTDEIQYTENEFRNAGYIRVNNIETFIRETVVKNVIFIKFSDIKVDTSGYSEYDKKWSLDVLCKSMRYAVWKIDNKTTVKLLIPFNTYFGFEYKKKYVSIYVVDTSLENTNLIPYKLTDTLIIGKKKIKFDTLDSKGSFLNYNVLSKNEKIKFGFNVGDIIEDLILEFSNSHKTNIYNIKKLIVFDFWGSWCAPCKKVYPLIDTLRAEIANSKFKDNVIFINVAFENDETISVYHEQMKSKYLFWHSILINNSDRNNIISKLHISTYPTLILIDTDYKIISRVAGLNEFSVFKDSLKKRLSRM